MASWDAVAAAPLWHFDARRFGREVRTRRRTAGYSTRALARRAGLSQPYVVALERSTSSRDTSGPTPSAAAVVALATALQTHPTDLLSAALLQAGPHVLYVVEGDGQETFGTARDRLAGIDVWLSAGHRRDETSSIPHITTHPTDDLTYRRDLVGSAIRQDLLQLQEVVRDQQVGIVFSDVDTALLETTPELLAIERQWQSLVSDAGWAADVASVSSVCVYELEVLEQMASPVQTIVDLVDCHDQTWFSDGRRTCTGRQASMRVLQRFRPPRTPAREWRETCARHLDARRPTSAPGAGARAARAH